MSDQDLEYDIIAIVGNLYKATNEGKDVTVWAQNELQALIAREVRLGQAKLLKKCYVDQGEIYVRLPNGFMEQYHYASELSKEDAL